jgi:hypothetical protein
MADIRQSQPEPESTRQFPVRAVRCCAALGGSASVRLGARVAHTHDQQSCCNPHVSGSIRLVTTSMSGGIILPVACVR